jgi:putative ABC transport system permease protein
MSAVLRQAAAELRRRRLQTAVIVVVALLTSGAATLAANLLLETDAPFQHAFAAANGAHLTLTYDGALVGAAEAAATTHAPGVTAASGPWQEIGVVFDSPDGAGAIQPSARVAPRAPGGRLPAPPIAVWGRDRPDTSVDRLTMDSGRWASGPAEIVLSRSAASRFGVTLGDHLVASGAPGAPRLTVVGIAAAIIPQAGAWVRPQDLGALVEPGAPWARPRYEVAYRVSPAATADDLGGAARSITAGLPASAVTDTVSYLDIERNADIVSSVMVPFLVAFSVFALAATVMVVTNVITGVVIASQRDIGIMKSVGFAPAQVSAVLTLEVLLPAAAGAAAGAAIGTLASVPFLTMTAGALDLPAPLTDFGPIAAAVVAGMLALVLLAALVPAWRAGRLSAIAAITRGSAPGTSAAGPAAAFLGRLPLPAAARLGLSDVLARPVRAAMTLGAIAVGVTTVVFALGLHQSLTEVAHHLIRDHYVQVEAQLGDGGTIDQAQSLISADRDTARSVAEGRSEVSVPGVAEPVPYYGYRGDASWIGYALIDGRWFSRPGEVVAPTRFLRQSGLHVGDTFNAVTRPTGGTVRLTLVGEILDEQGDDVLLRGDWAALAAAEPRAQLDGFEIQLRSGADAGAYVLRLGDAGGGILRLDTTGHSDTNTNFVLLQTVVAGLGLVLTAIAVAGVFNTVVLTTRERLRDVAILKAVGMAPGQVVAMVVASVAGLGAAAGLAGVPLGLLLHAQVLVLMAQTASGTGIPPGFVDVIAHWQLPLLALAGVAVAAAGAWLPARWAAGGPVAEVLAAE